MTTATLAKNKTKKERMIKLMAELVVAVVSQVRTDEEDIIFQNLLSLNE